MTRFVLLRTFGNRCRKVQICRCENNQMPNLVIVVDLDGTLISTDTLYEQVVRLIFRKFWKIPGAIGALFKGKAAFKSYNAEEIPLEVSSFSYQGNLVKFLRISKDSGAHIVLCTAADVSIAEAISKHHAGLFDTVIGTENGINMKGAAKAAVLKERFPDGFVYAGDSSADLAVWQEADEIILVGANKKTTRKAKGIGKPVIGEYRHAPEYAGNRFRIWVKALRVHHWAKNVLIFFPLFLAHSWSNEQVVVQTLAGFLLLLAVTSSSYLINDLADLDADRKHPTKRRRPIASGVIAIRDALLVPILLLPIVIGAGFILEPAFGFTLLGYLVLTLGYSFGLKRIPLLDTFVIGVLFTSRIVMGGVFLGTGPSDWLLLFSMFFFFSLAAAKRQAEVLQMKTTINASSSGRGYVASDAPLLLAVGAATSVASILILVLYIRSKAFNVVGYTRPDYLWVMVGAIAIWLGRIWLLTHRGQMLDDPVNFALRDKSSIMLGVFVMFAFMVSV